MVFGKAAKGKGAQRVKGVFFPTSGFLKIRLGAEAKIAMRRNNLCQPRKTGSWWSESLHLHTAWECWGGRARHYQQHQGCHLAGLECTQACRVPPISSCFSLPNEIAGEHSTPREVTKLIGEWRPALIAVTVTGHIVEIPA